MKKQWQIKTYYYAVYKDRNSGIRYNGYKDDEMMFMHPYPGAEPTIFNSKQTLLQAINKKDKADYKIDILKFTINYNTD